MSLPPEILLRILRTAAGEPHYSLDTSPLSSSRLVDWRRSWTHPPSQGRTARMKTKTALVLVSKHWHAVASEILFEWVDLRTMPQFNAFLQVMHDDWMMLQNSLWGITTSSGRQIGRYVKCFRIHIQIRDEETTVTLHFKNGLTSLVRLFNNLELLSIFSMGNGGNGDYWRTVCLRMMEDIGKNGCRLRSIYRVRPIFQSLACFTRLKSTRYKFWSCGAI
jgi:hypothetical protein